MENNKFTRDLKYVYFELDRDTKQVLIKNKRTGEKVTLNKVYTFSLFRFLVSAAQKLTVTPRGAKKAKKR